MGMETTNEDALKAFWDLAEVDPSKRLHAAERIMNTPTLHLAGSVAQMYTLKRLVRGLSSSRGSARQGFAVTLTNVVRSVDSIDLDELLKQIMESTVTVRSMRGTEERDSLFGRIFGFMVLVRSGKAVNNPDILTKVITESITLMNKRSWITEIASEIACDALDCATPTCLSVVLENLCDMETMHRIETVSEWSPGELAIAVALTQKVPTKLKSKLTGKLPLLDWSDEAVMEGIVTPLRNSCRTFPRLHSVWPRLMTEMSKDVSVFKAFWDNTIIPEFVVEGSHERKYCAMKLLEFSVGYFVENQLVEETMETLLAPALMKSLLRNASSSKHILHIHAEECLAKVASIITQGDVTEDLRVAVINILKQNGLQNKVSSTVIVGDKDQLDMKAARKKLASLQADVVKHSKDEEDVPTWTLNSMHSIAKNVPTITDKYQLYQDIASFLFTQIFFQQGNSLAYQETCVKQLQNVVNDATVLEYASYVRALKQGDLGTFFSNEEEILPGTCVDGLFELWTKLEKKSGLSIELTAKETGARSKAAKMIKKLKTVNSESIGFKLLLQHLSLQLLFLELETEEVNVDLVEAIEDICICAPTLCQGNTKQSDMVVVVDSLIALLAQESSLIRSSVKLVFTMLSSLVNEGALEAILDLLLSKNTAPKSSGEPQDDEDSDAEEDDDKKESSNDESKDHQHDDENSDPEEDDDKSKSSDDESNNRQSDALAAFVKMKIESKAANSKAMRRKQELEKITIKLRVLDLLEAFLKAQPSSPLVCLVPLPLMRASMHCLSYEGNFKSDLTESVSLYNRMKSVMEATVKNGFRHDDRQCSFHLAMDGPFYRQVTLTEQAMHAKDSTQEMSPAITEEFVDLSLTEVLKHTLQVSQFQLKYSYSNEVYTVALAASQYALVAGAETHELMDVEFVKTQYQTTLESFLGKKNSKVKMSNFETLIKHSSVNYSFALLEDVCWQCLQVKNSFQLSQGLALISSLLKQKPLRASLEEVSKSVSDLLVWLLNKVLSGDQLVAKGARVKSVFAACNEFARACKNADLKLTETSELIAVLTAMQGSDKQGVKAKAVQLLNNAQHMLGLNNKKRKESPVELKSAKKLKKQEETISTPKAFKKSKTEVSSKKSTKKSASKK